MSLLDIQRRMRELGRIRLGAQIATKTGKLRPTKLERFRLTSPQRELIEAAAKLWGGECRPWEGAPGDAAQWEVFTSATAIEAIVPPQSSLSQFYELWSGGGCQRRCDGLIEQLGDRACMCPKDPEERRTAAAAGEACKPTTRLSLILPQLPDIGVWRAEMHGFYAAVELAGAYDICSLATARGAMVPVRLRLDPREKRRPGQPTLKWVVPVLELGATIGELVGALGLQGPGGLLLAPQTALAALPAPSADDRLSQLPQGRVREGMVDLADGLAQVADGAPVVPAPRSGVRRAAPMPGTPLLGDAAFEPGARGGPEPAPPQPTVDESSMPGTAPATAAQVKRLHTLASKLGWTDEERHEMAGVSSFNDLSKERASEIGDEWAETLKTRESEAESVSPTQPAAPPPEESTGDDPRESGGFNGEPSPTSVAPENEEPGVRQPLPSTGDEPGVLDRGGAGGRADSSAGATVPEPASSFDPAALPTEEHWKRAMRVCAVRSRSGVANRFAELFGERMDPQLFTAGDLQRLLDAILNGQQVLA